MGEGEAEETEDSEDTERRTAVLAWREDPLLGVVERRIHRPLKNKTSWRPKLPAGLGGLCRGKS